MLVLSRRQNDKIVFPHLGVNIEILRITGNSVRLGIEAPREISVLRHEVADRGEPTPPPRPAPRMSHQLRNRLHAANLALHLVGKQLERGLIADAEKTLERALESFAELDQQVAAEARAAEARRRALVVEDNRNESELLAAFLRLSGFHVDTAGDGDDALDILAHKERPDVVLLDLNMPRRDGASTISAIRCNPGFEGLKVFAVSGESPENLGVKSGPQGFDRWFPKPVNPEKLVREICRDLSVVEQAG